MNLAMETYRIKPQSFPWPPVHFAMALIAAFILRQIAPLPVSGGPVALLSGLFLLGASLLLDIWAALTLRAGGTAVLPHKAASHLVTRGPFHFTRNPIYLGYILILAGCGLMAADAWFFIAAILSVVLMTLVSIRREEMHLLARFGGRFEDYCRATPRWL